MPASGVLQRFGMVGADHSVALQLEKQDGETLTIQLPLALGNVPKIGIAEGLHIPDVLYRSHPNAWYWFRYLADSQTLFILYNRCANDSIHHFGDVARQALAEADSHPVKRVVIDLRWNGGGDSTVINPLKNGLDARLKLPNSKLVVRFTTKYFGPKDDGAKTLAPDIAAPFRLADFITGRDPALDAAITAAR